MDAASAGGTSGIVIAVISGLFGLTSLWLTTRWSLRRRQGALDELAGKLAIRDANEIAYLRGLLADRDRVIADQDREITRLNRLLAKGRAADDRS